MCRRTEPRSRHAISEQCPLRGVDAPHTDSSENLGDIWQGRGRPLHLKRQLSLPNLLFEERGLVGPRMAQPPPVCFFPDRSDPSGNQMSQGAQAQSASGGPALEEPSLDLRAVSAAFP